MRWDAATDLTTFMADLSGQIAILNRHQFAPTAGEQVLLLQTAVAHVQVFANKADAAFHMQRPNRADQTLPHLITAYERVYRNEYEKTTAAEILTVNQVQDTSTCTGHDGPVLQAIMASARAVIRDTAVTPAIAAEILTVNQVQDTSTCTGHDGPVLQAIMASARAVIRDTAVTPAMLDHLATEITKTVARCLHPPKAEAASSGGGYKGKKQSDKDTGGGYTPTLKTPHTWEKCFLNPDRKA